MDQKTKAFLIDAAGFLLIVGIRVLVSRLQKRPDSRAARLLLTPRGPDTEVPWMSRRELLRSGGAFLLWGLLFFGIYAATIVLAGDALTESPLLLGISFFWAFGGLMALGGGLYLCARGLFRSAKNLRPSGQTIEWEPEGGKPPPIA